MALTKRTYVDGQTIITAANLNDIQDHLITVENNYVPKTRTVAGKALSSNITLAASDVGAVPTSRTINAKALTGNITLSAADVGAVPVARTVNGKALSSNITLNAADVGAVPTSRTVNSKALSSNITLVSGDIGDDSGAGGSTVKASLAALKGSLNSDLYQYEYKNIDTKAEGWRLNISNGLCSSDALYVLKKYKVDAGTTVQIHSDDRFQFQNKASVPSSGTSNRVGETYGQGDFELIVPITATYLIVSTPISNSTATVKVRGLKAEQYLSVSMINPGGKGGSVGASILFITPNGKWLLMDTHVNGYGVYNGNIGAFTKILQDKSPTGKIRIDYLMISHYHIDHVGGLIDWIDNGYLTNGTVDISNATVFLPQELTSTNIANIVGDTPSTLIERQTKIVNALTAQNCTIIRPSEGQTFDIDGATLRFTNCDHSVYTSGTYASTNYNDWSLCAYVETESQRFFYTADIGPVGQKYTATLSNSLLKSDIMTAPHHGWQSGQTEENGLNPDFIKRIYPNIVLSPNGEVHKPDSGQAASMYNYENVLQTWCEENSVPNYPTCLNGTIDFYMYNQSWEFNKSYIAYIRNNKNWSYNIEKSITIVPSHVYLVRKGGFAYIWLLGVDITNSVTYYSESNTSGITDKIAEFYKINNWGNTRSFSSYGISKQNNTGGLNGNVHAILVAINYGSDPYIGVFAKNLQGDTIDTTITGLFFLE